MGGALQTDPPNLVFTKSALTSRVARCPCTRTYFANVSKLKSRCPRKFWIEKCPNRPNFRKKCLNLSVWQSWSIFRSGWLKVPSWPLRSAQNWPIWSFLMQPYWLLQYIRKCVRMCLNFVVECPRLLETCQPCLPRLPDIPDTKYLGARVVLDTIHALINLLWFLYVSIYFRRFRTPLLCIRPCFPTGKKNHIAEGHRKGTSLQVRPFPNQVRCSAARRRTSGPRRSRLFFLSQVDLRRPVSKRTFAIEFFAKFLGKNGRINEFALAKIARKERKKRTFRA